MSTRISRQSSLPDEEQCPLSSEFNHTSTSPVSGSDLEFAGFNVDDDAASFLVNMPKTARLEAAKVVKTIATVSITA